MNASHNREDVPAIAWWIEKRIAYWKFHFDGTNLMQQLLESEGIEVVENQIVNFENILGTACK
jgi:methylated-DNA-protein-cysteine methyltransferase-like protein